MEVVQFIIGNADAIFTILGSLVAAATVFVGLTESRKDDKIVGVIRGIVERLSLLSHNEGVVSTSRSNTEDE